MFRTVFNEQQKTSGLIYSSFRKENINVKSIVHWSSKIYIIQESIPVQWLIQDFPEVGAPTLKGAPTYDFAKFLQKLHEIERIWTPKGGGGARLTFYYVDPLLQEDEYEPLANCRCLSGQGVGIPGTM